MIIGIRNAALDICQCVRGLSIVSKIHIEILPDLYHGRQFVIITEIFDWIWNILRFCNYHSNVEFSVLFEIYSIS